MEEILKIKIKSEAGGRLAGSFDSIYDKHHKNVYNYIAFRINNQHDAEELANDVFVKAMGGQKNYNPDFAMEAWLIGIAKNVVTDYLRKTSRRHFVPLDNLIGLISTNKQPEEVVVLNEEIKGLISAMTLLKEKERQILSMKFATDLKHREIGEILGISESHVKVAAHRALNKLRAYMKEENYEK